MVLKEGAMYLVTYLVQEYQLWIVLQAMKVEEDLLHFHHPFLV
jgi:hypothetical protein